MRTKLLISAEISHPVQKLVKSNLFTAKHGIGITVKLETFNPKYKSKYLIDRTPKTITWDLVS